MGQHTHFLCSRDCVQPLLGPDNISAEGHSHLSHSKYHLPFQSVTFTDKQRDLKVQRVDPVTVNSLGLQCMLINTLWNAGFHLGLSSRGGANVTIAELRGGEDYINTSNAILIARNIIELIDFLKLGGLGECSPKKIFNISNFRDCFWWLLGPNFQGWGEACQWYPLFPPFKWSLYTVASMNTSV